MSIDSILGESFRVSTRRSFLRSGAALSAAALVSNRAYVRAATNKNSKLQILQIGVNGIGNKDREELMQHPMVQFVGFCDVDATAFGKVDQDPFKGAWRIADYREAFADRCDQFDAVIIDTPDFNHCPMAVTALKYNKHVYGQKPLVQQLDELRVIREAIKARPKVYTQMGIQLSCLPAHMQAVEILRTGRLGKAVEAHIWARPMGRKISKFEFFVDPWSSLPEAQPIPDTMSWELWQGPLTQPMPYSADLHPRCWRTFWDTGTGMLGDWGCHLIDLLYFAYDLGSPETVQTDTPKPSGVGHSGYNHSVLTYAGGGDRFAREKFVVHYADSDIHPPFAALGMPIPEKIGNYSSLVVCEEGALLLDFTDRLEIYRKGKLVKDERLPEVGPRNHWKDWADCCLGNKKPLWGPFEVASRISEPTLLAVKATRFPNQELHWDGANYRFTNHEEANKTLLSRSYREGFAPPSLD